MIPTILISSFITLLAPFITDYYWGGSFISGLNAIITLLISLVNYYKFETTNQIFSNLAKQYDKLQTKLEIANSKLLFIDNEVDQTNLIMEKIHEFEDKMSEIKESTSIFIPEELKSLFPLICHINVFSLIKKIETYKKTLIVKYKDVKNEMRYIFYKYNNINININNIDHISHKLSSPVHSPPHPSSQVSSEINRSKNRLLLFNFKSGLPITGTPEIYNIVVIINKNNDKREISMYIDNLYNFFLFFICIYKAIV